MLSAAALIVAGGLGAVTRALVDALGSRWPPTPTEHRGAVLDSPRIPWPTTAINVTGSLAAGMVAGAVSSHAAAPPLANIVGVGFLGAFTTFSTAMLQTIDLLAVGARGRALIHAALPLAAGVGAAALGWALTG